MTTYIIIGCVVTISNILIGALIGSKLPSPDGLLDAIALLISWMIFVVIWPYQFVLIIRGFIKGFKGTREESD